MSNNVADLIELRHHVKVVQCPLSPGQSGQYEVALTNQPNNSHKVAQALWRDIECPGCQPESDNSEFWKTGISQYGEIKLSALVALPSPLVADESARIKQSVYNSKRINSDLLNKALDLYINQLGSPRSHTSRGTNNQQQWYNKKNAAGVHTGCPRPSRTGEMETEGYQRRIKETNTEAAR